jgi:hypothetical protein
MSDKDISERNVKLINIIKHLDLGIHILNLPHKPKFLTHDYKYQINAYAHNFELILMSSEEDVFHEEKIKSVESMDIDKLRDKFVYLMSMYEQKRVYVLSYNRMFLTGFNHHNKIERTNPYPVFASYDPLIYYDYDKAINTADKYDLKVL